MSLLRHTDDEAQKEALSQRVHGVQRTCGWCGIVATCEVDDVIWRTDLNGDALQFGRCRTCTKIRPEVFDRTVASRLLGVDVDAVLLDGLRVTKFHDRSTAHPDRPNSAPWEHVDRTALGDAAERNRQDVERRHGGPCWVCGTTLTPPGTRWTTPPGSTVTECGRCERWLDATSYTDDGVRILAAAVLLGGASPAQRPYGPPGLAVDIGFGLFIDSGRTKGTIEPFGYLDQQTRETIAANARSLGYGDTLDPARWLLIDGYRMR